TFLRNVRRIQPQKMVRRTARRAIPTCLSEISRDASTSLDMTMALVEALVPSALFIWLGADTNPATPFQRDSDRLRCCHGSSNNRDDQERPLHREGRSGINRRRRKQVSG